MINNILVYFHEIVYSNIEMHCICVREYVVTPDKQRNKDVT